MKYLPVMKNSVKQLIKLLTPDILLVHYIEEIMKEINEALLMYKGTKNFHNFTSGK